MDFPWLDRTRSRPEGAAVRLAASQRELRDRAAVYFRLGYTEKAATARLAAAIAWEYDPPYGAHERPAGLSDAAIAAAVRETFARRPSGVL